MKRKILFFGLASLFIVASVVVFVKSSNNAGIAPALLSNVEALASDEFDEIFDGGEIPGANITCNSGGSGSCYYIAVEEGLFGVCRFSCEWSGSPSDGCSSFWVGLLNFCSAISVGV